MVQRSVFVLGARLGTPNASSIVRRSLAAESSSESLAVASVMAGAVEATRRGGEEVLECVLDVGDCGCNFLNQGGVFC